jgi:REP element-mobilizing transposase RayT
VTSRGVGRAAIFRSERDYSVFVATLNETGNTASWGCLGYCLMPNHYHLLIRTPDATSLSKGVQSLNGTYASRYNSAHERSGHLFQGRFHDELVHRDEHLLEALRYIALNPVRAGLVARPDLWQWSSHTATAGGRRSLAILDAASVLALFAGDPEIARRRYTEFVADGLQASSRPPLKTLIHPTTRNGVARAHDDFGYTQTQLAAYLGVSQPTVCRMIARDRRR